MLYEDQGGCHGIVDNEKANSYTLMLISIKLFNSTRHELTAYTYQKREKKIPLIYLRKRTKVRGESVHSRLTKL